MPDPIELTFAEFEFLLEACPNQASAVRDWLRISPPSESGSRALAVSGLASLLLRRLCVPVGSTVRPAPPLVTVIAGLSTCTVRIEATGWNKERSVLMHYFGGPSVQLALFPGLHGGVTVHVFDPGTRPSTPLGRFLDACAAGQTEGAAFFQSSGGGEDGGGPSLTVAVTESGQWHLSDSIDGPDHGERSSRDGAIRRLSSLFDSMVTAGTG